MEIKTSNKAYYFIAHCEELSGSVVLLRTLVKTLESNGYICHLIFLAGKRTYLFAGNNFLYIDELLGEAVFWPRKMLFVRRRLVNLIIQLYIFFGSKKSVESIIIYNAVNSIPKGGGIKDLIKVKKYAWIHESKYLLNLHGENLKNIKNQNLEFLVSSQIALNDLKDFLLHCGTFKIHSIGAAIDSENYKKVHNGKKVLINGYMDWNKGSDLILPIISLVLKKLPHVIFKVVVSNDTSQAFLNFKNDMIRLGINNNNIEIYHSLRNAEEIYNDVKLCLILSRNESLSLVGLEAMYREIPFLFFEGCGGPEEIVGNNCLFSIPFLDLNSMSERIAELYMNESSFLKAMNSLNNINKEFYSAERLLERFLSAT
jgi:glycosyltransferase involved in cell wall biosynthesis